MAIPTSNFFQVLRLVQLASRKVGVSFAELEREVGLPRKKIWEYVEALNQVGIPPFDAQDYMDFDIRGNRVFVFYHLNLNHPVNLSHQDILALLLALVWAGQSGLIEESALAPIRAKILTIETSSGIQFDVEGIRVQVAEELPGKEYLQPLSDAIQAEQLISMAYYSLNQGELTMRIVAPYRLYFREGYWYLRAYQKAQAGLTAGWRSLRLDRIRDCKTLEGVFCSNDLPDLASGEHLLLFEDGSKTTTRTHFFPNTARHIREFANHNQIEEQDNGSLILTYPVVGFPYFRSFVLQYGADAVVLSPENYRQALVDQLGQLLKVVE